MSTITIGKTIKHHMDYYKDDDESIDNFINRLLDIVEDDLSDVPIIDGNISIRVSPDTLSRLRSLKRTDNDSYTKLLSDAMVLYSSRS